MVSAGDPLLSVDELGAWARHVLSFMTADQSAVLVEQTTTAVTRVAENRARLGRDSNILRVRLESQFGRRVPVALETNQLDLDEIRSLVQYLESVARTQPGDSRARPERYRTRTYLPNTAWVDATAAMVTGTHDDTVAQLIAPVVGTDLRMSAFIAASVHAVAYADTHGMHMAGHETDAEVTVTGWVDGASGEAWVGHATRDWRTVDPAHLASRLVTAARRSANPVAVEPGRRVVILDRPAVAPFLNQMREDVGAWTLSPLQNAETGVPRLREQVLDARLTIRSDPNDPDGGYLPFNVRGFPEVATTWIDRGIFMHQAYSPYFAADAGVSPPREAVSFRLDGGTTSIDAMIAMCEEGIFVTRVMDLYRIDQLTGMTTGVTAGGCFLIKSGAIVKAVKDFRFLESPYSFLRRVMAVGTSARAAFGYAPSQGTWPIAPTIVPPLMIRDFNFIALAESL